jgi:hypothetical protein
MELMGRAFGNTLGGGGVSSIILLVWRWLTVLLPGSNMIYGVEIIL